VASLASLVTAGILASLDGQGSAEFLAGQESADSQESAGIRVTAGSAALVASQGTQAILE
jgi:hypothetical protein